MNNVYVDAKDEKEDEKIEAEETTETMEETTEETTEEAEETTEETEETQSSSESSEEEKEFDYKVYGKETVEETKNIAEKMFNDVVASLKTKQDEWNKTFEEYKANKPAVDLLECPDNLVIKLDAPRAKKEDVSVKMSTDSVEIIIGFPDYLEDEEDVKVLRRERCFGQTKNIIPLPVDVDIKEVKATFKDEELTIIIPKIKGKKVDVEIV
ncbi:MAG: Hsp20/alpha crystallin family protein [Methanosphaera sp.]|nr:Hsp20/alpha crystallin family protein [Methanosphaera sp.]